MLRANQVKDNIEHRGLLPISHLTSDDWDNVRSNPLSRKMTVDLVALYQNHAPPGLGSARAVLRLLLYLYPLVVYHSGAKEHQIKPSFGSGAPTPA